MMSGRTNLTVQLYQERQRRVLERRRMYKDILAQCIEKIKTYNARYNHTCCYFDVPPFIMGRPYYNLIECVYFLIYRLKKEGVRCQYIYPNRLLISWALRVNRKPS